MPQRSVFVHISEKNRLFQPFHRSNGLRLNRKTVVPLNISSNWLQAIHTRFNGRLSNFEHRTLFHSCILIVRQSALCEYKNVSLLYCRWYRRYYYLCIMEKANNDWDSGGKKKANRYEKWLRLLRSVDCSYEEEKAIIKVWLKKWNCSKSSIPFSKTTKVITTSLVYSVFHTKHACRSNRFSNKF